MDRLQLRQIIEEMLSELSPETLGSYIKKASKDRAASAEHRAGRRPSAAQMKQDDKLLATDRKKLRPFEKKKHDTLTGERDKKRTKGIEAATDKLVAGASGGSGPKVKNPETGTEILATTAYKAGPSHPAYAAAKTALKKEIAVRKETDAVDEKLAPSGGPSKADRKAAIKQQTTQNIEPGWGADRQRFAKQSKMSTDPRSAYLQMRQARSKGPKSMTPQALRTRTDKDVDAHRAGYTQQSQASIATDRSRKAQALKQTGGGAVPPAIQQAVVSGGKVVFGRYFDSSGKYLGRTQGGKWMDASQDTAQKQLEQLKEMQSRKTTRLTDLLMENAERRVNLMKIQAIMEKLYPELTDTQTKKLMELCTEVHMMASQMNTIPYIRTESSLVEWTVLVAAFKAKVNELKEEVVKVCEDKKIDCTTAVKALDEVLTY